MQKVVLASSNAGSGDGRFRGSLAMLSTVCRFRGSLAMTSKASSKAAVSADDQQSGSSIAR